MKLQIDTTEGKVVAQLVAATRDNRYNVPLVRAMCRNTICETISHDGAARFHYFRFDDAANAPTVEFSFNNRKDVNNSELVAELALKSQDFLSREMERLIKLQDDFDTLKAAFSRNVVEEEASELSSAGRAVHV